MADEVFNPFDEKNFVAGGGLWDGKIVTITSAKTLVDKMAYKDGSPYLNDKGEQSYRNVLALVGIAEDTEKERRETYGAGMLIPTADGEGFTKPDGKPGRFHSNSDIAKFIKYLLASGFPVDTLWDATTGKQQFSKLAGTRFEFKGEVRLGKDGKEKKNSKGYTENRYYPVKFIGYAAGASASAASSKGNGVSDELKDKAVTTVVELLGENGGKLTRTELVRKVSAKLAKDPDAAKVLTLLTRPEFHQNVPWTQDGTGYTL